MKLWVSSHGRFGMQSFMWCTNACPFHFERYGKCLCSLEAYATLMNDCASQLLERLQAAAASSTEIDMWQVMGDMTMHVIGSAAFGWSLAHCLCSIVTPAARHNEQASSLVSQYTIVSFNIESVASELTPPIAL